MTKASDADRLRAELESWKTDARAAQAATYQHVALLNKIAETLGEDESEAARARLPTAVKELRDLLTMHLMLEANRRRQHQETIRLLSGKIVRQILGSIAVSTDGATRDRLAAEHETYWATWIGEQLKILVPEA